MAIAATPIFRNSDLLNLLRQVVPPQERAVELYRRLLAINELSDSMNSATDVHSIQSLLAAYFQEYFPDEGIWLCLRDGVKYRRHRLTGPDSPKEEDLIPPDKDIAESVMKSRMPLWIPDTHTSPKPSRHSGAETPFLARSILVLPFSIMGKAVGCLKMLSNSPGRFDEIEYHLGLLVAGHLTSSLENVLARQNLATANARLKDHDQRLTQLNERLQQLAHTDEATGLFNKRRLFERLEMEIARAKRYREVFCCLMLDIDDFKKVNDTYGHQAGDEVLRQTGALLQHSLRRTDFIARYGGEEFTIILPRTNSAGAQRAAENLRSTFMSHKFVIPSTHVRLTVSIGIACCASFGHLEAQQIINQSDTALYQAKRNGKNQVCLSDDIEFVYPESEFCQTWETGLTQ